MPNHALRTLYIFNGIFVFASSLLGPLYAVFVQEINASVLTVSYSWAAFMVATVIFTYFISKYGDGVREQEYLLLGGFLVRSIVWFLYVFTVNIEMLIVLQIFLGLGEALGSPAYNAIFAKHLDIGKQVAQYSHWMIVERLCVALAVVLGGYIVSYFGFASLFFIMSALALISFFGVLVKPRKLL